MNTEVLTTIHAVVGMSAVLCGLLAFVLAKGSLFHRVAGRFFTGLIVSMVAIVSAEAFLKPGSISALGFVFILLMAYLVGSAWATVRVTVGSIRTVDLAAPLVAFSIFIACCYLGAEALSNPKMTDKAPPVEAYFFFGTLTFITMLLDLNHIRLGGTRGNHKIIRHVWRMSLALFLSSSTLFTGPGSIIFPEPIRGNPALAIPQILVVCIALYWVSNLLLNQRRQASVNKQSVKPSVQVPVTTK